MDNRGSKRDTLETEGWSKRFVACEPRLSEATDMYGTAGFDVHLEPLSKEADCQTCAGEEDEAECRICFEGSEDQYMIIYTRPKRGKAESDEDLF